MIVTITVTAGSGETIIEVPSGWGKDLSIISPDSTPSYDFAVLDGDGHLCAIAFGVTANPVKVEAEYFLRGACSFMIANAADDGAYYVKPFLKKDGNRKV